MSTQAPRNTEEHGQVLQFPSRKAPKASAFSNLSRRNQPEAAHAVRDLGRFSHATSEHDDFSHRMKMNALAGAVLLILIGGGLWIVDAMTEMRKNQDCALSGRRNCTTIAAPINTR
jgi:hypothetical protein